MVNANKMFRGADAFNKAAQDWLYNNAHRFKKIQDIDSVLEFRLFLPKLGEIAGDKPNCINIDVQRYRDCLVKVFGYKHSPENGGQGVVFTVYDQFDQILFNEMHQGAHPVTWIHHLIVHIYNAEHAALQG